MLKKLYSVLEEFKTPKFMIEQEIYSKIGKFIKEEMKGKELQPDSPLAYEETAFAFMEAQASLPSEWGDTFYAPLGGRTDSLGKWLHAYPDIKNITPEMMNYWEKRASETENPILRCRYAGLAWDFSQKIKNKKPDISFAHKFIDSIIELTHLSGDPFLKHKLRRGLELAVRINDRKRILSLRDSIVNYESAHSEDKKPGTWGYAFDLLIGEFSKKAQLKENQEKKIIEDLERRLIIFSDKKLNPDIIEHITTKLSSYYKAKKDKENMRRVLLIYRDSVLHGVEKNLVRVGSHWLEKVRTILFQHGLSNEAKQLEEKIRKFQKEDLNYLQKHEVAGELPKKEVDRYIKTLDSQTFSEALATIAISFIPDKEQAKNIVLKTAREHPLSTLIPQKIIDHKGRKVAEVGPLKDDLKGHIFLQMSQSLHICRILIKLGLERLEKTKSLNAGLLSKHLFQSTVFPKENHQIIEEGLKAYFNKNYLASCSMLIPQVEAAVRELMSKIGGNIYQPARSPEERGFDLRPLGALLRDQKFIKAFEKLNPNIPYYFQILLTDKIGLNLRNTVCHGSLPSAYFHKQTAVSIIHVLLILSLS